MPDVAGSPTSFSFNGIGVPEPETVALLGAGLVLLAKRRPGGPRAAR
jgi:hypothetical protein